MQLKKIMMLENPIMKEVIPWTVKKKRVAGVLNVIVQVAFFFRELIMPDEHFVP